jgi:hypothetical protein
MEVKKSMLGYKEEKKNKIKMRKIKPTNINGFGFPPQNLDWSQVLVSIGIDEMINQFLPEKTIKRHSNDKPLITNKIRVLIAKRNRAFKSQTMELVKSLRNYSRFHETLTTNVPNFVVKFASSLRSCKVHNEIHKPVCKLRI